jgi:hypothetical protein
MRAIAHVLGVGARGWLLMMVLAASGVALLAHQGVEQATTAEHLDAAREVRALRAEVQQAVRDIMAAQTTVGRLQLIDRRMSFLAAQLGSVRGELAALEVRRQKPLAALKRAEGGIADGLQGFDDVLAQARADLAEVDDAERQLRAREAQFVSQMKSEEQRWITLDAHLGQLEAAPR